MRPSTLPLECNYFIKRVGRRTALASTARYKSEPLCGSKVANWINWGWLAAAETAMVLTKEAICRRAEIISVAARRLIRTILDGNDVIAYIKNCWCGESMTLFLLCVWLLRNEIQVQRVPLLCIIFNQPGKSRGMEIKCQTVHLVGRRVRSGKKATALRSSFLCGKTGRSMESVQRGPLWFLQLTHRACADWLTKLKFGLFQ